MRGDISKVTGVVVWGLMCSSSAPWAFCNPSEKVKEWYKNSPSSGHLDYLLLREWVSLQLESEWPEAALRPLAHKCSDQGFREGRGRWASVDNSDLLSFRSFESAVWTSPFFLTCPWSGWKCYEAECGARRNLRHRDCRLGLSSVLTPEATSVVPLRWFRCGCMSLLEPGITGHSLPAFLNLIQFWLNSFDKYFLICLPGIVPSVRDTRDGYSSCHPGSYKTGRGDSPVSWKLMTACWGETLEPWDDFGKAMEPVLVPQREYPGKWRDDA